MTCPCGRDHDAITSEQVIAAELRKPRAAKEHDPFPDLPGSSTLGCATTWYRGAVFLTDEAAAKCATPEVMNRAEVRLESELLRHVKAGLRTAGLAIPEWAQGTSPASTE